MKESTTVGRTLKESPGKEIEVVWAYDEKIEGIRKTLLGPMPSNIKYT